ncbi:STAS domain-containing protein [Chitinophaga niastensis]|uniref:STAS domain-containing protein n=1 Tax=Chitinophaga niastensis TaxID=536980 RepID=A0A2P8H8X5_CHINA|nr:STAS domain-containing protein [Chitinophaga niastensis]PSL42685.1 STAS domain-containing protein [Chitinophaga niastensis]
MKFKIDTKEKIVVFCPEEDTLDANLSADFLSTITSLPELEGRNLILDLSLVQKIDATGVEAILTVYETLYGNNLSCAITGLNNTLTAQLKETGSDMLNLAPTMAEAIDLIMMEELERELMDGLGE